MDDAYDQANYEAKLSMGFRICMFWGLFAMAFLTAAWQFAEKRKREEARNGSGTRGEEKKAMETSSV